MRKDLCPPSLINYENQMESYLTYEWPREIAQAKLRKRLLLLLKIAAAVAVLTALVAIGLIWGGE